MFAPLALIMLISGGVSTAYVVTQEDRVASVEEDHQPVMLVGDSRTALASSVPSAAE